MPLGQQNDDYIRRERKITMTTITEDYCSREVYKLLIEKGFDGEIHTTYDKEGYTQPSITLQTAMKWLREVHNIMVSPYALSLGYYFEIFDLTNRDITGCKPLYKVGIPNKEDVLSTYEEACETAIKYFLEHLI